jgi:prepilin-type N-terminal cleavage/methylation domain-containing protein/prepilin-type processing-associated H-X9-DG protein
MKARGFTLTEVLVALAIIAVLAGIAYPVSRSLVGRSREAACLGNLRSIGVGLQGYLQDHGQKLPNLEAGRSGKNTDAPVLETVLLPYVDSPEVFHCPEDRREFARSGSSYIWNSTQSGLHVSKLSFFGIEGRLDRIPLVGDKEAWHPGGSNFLYADSSISTRLRLSAGN